MDRDTIGMLLTILILSSLIFGLTVWMNYDSYKAEVEKCEEYSSVGYSVSINQDFWEDFWSDDATCKIEMEDGIFMPLWELESTWNREPKMEETK